MRWILDSLFSFLLIATLAVGATSPRTSYADDLRQLIVVRVAANTKARIQHERGDQIALLLVKDAPADFEDIIAQQTGPWCTRIERRSIVSDTQTFALYLANTDVTLRADFSKRPRALRVYFTPTDKPARPAPNVAIGRIAGLSELDGDGAALPAPPSRTPCAPSGNAAHCGHFTRAMEAAAALKQSRRLDDYERWAFRFRTESQWPNDLPAFAFTALIAARVLINKNLMPEAETLLTTRSSLQTKPIAPYATLALADVYDATQRSKEAEEVLATLAGSNADPAIRSHAILASLRRSIENRRLVDTAARIEVLPGAGLADGDPSARAWALAGEVAMAFEDLEGAYARFSRALDEAKQPALRAQIHLRLGDIALGPGGSSRAAKRHYAKAKLGACSIDRLRLRTLMTRKRVDDHLEKDLQRIATEGTCFAARVEAGYALAFLYSTRGNDLLGIEQLIHLRATKPGGMGAAWAVDTALDTAQGTLMHKWIERQSRAAKWTKIVEQFGGPLVSEIPTLNAEGMILLSEAYRRLGAESDIAQALLELLRGGTEPAAEEVILLELAEAYLAAGDEFRSEVTTRFYLGKFSDSGVAWRARQVAARLALRHGDPESALAELTAVEKQTPGGDPSQASAALRTEALMALSRTADAALSLVAWLDGVPTPTEGVRPLSVGIASACLRDCSTTLLERVLNRIGTFDGGALLTERMRVLAKQRGVTITPSTKDAPAGNGVWRRFDKALATSTEPN